MLNAVKGLKTTLVCLLCVSLIIFSMVYFQNIWQPFSRLISQLLLGLGVATIVFAAQFNRSRLSYLMAIWLLYYCGLTYQYSFIPQLLANTQWVFLYSVTLLMLLSIMKDRGIFSIHGVLRLVAIILLGVIVSGWFSALDWLVAFIESKQWPTIFNDYLLIEFPLAVVFLTMLWQSLRHGSLVNIALFTTLLVVSGQYYLWLTLPLSAVLLLLVVLYLFVVVVDSYFLAYRDELTGLPSRRALNQLSLSLGRKYTVAMLDIDHFKKFNDTYGHDIGDQVLKLVATKLAQVKGGGKEFRYGGEEFTIVFSGKEAQQTIEELERVRQLVADYKIVIRQPQRQTKQARKSTNKDKMKTVSVTISIGVASRASKQSFEQTLKVADQALYRAKKKGRNNVSL